MEDRPVDEEHPSRPFARTQPAPKKGGELQAASAAAYDHDRVLHPETIRAAWRGCEKTGAPHSRPDGRVSFKLLPPPVTKSGLWAPRRGRTVLFLRKKDVLNMLAELRYLDSRFKDHLESETGMERPAELCRLFAMISIIREELLYPRYVDVDLATADDLIAIMDLMRVIAGEVETATPSEVRVTRALIRQWRRLWQDHAALEEGLNVRLERPGSLPRDKYCEIDLKERLAGLESLSDVPVPEPVALEKLRSPHRPSGLVLDAFELDQS